MPQVFRLAVLECDTPYPAVAEAHGSYGDIFRDLLAQGLASIGSRGNGIELQVSKWNVISQQFPKLHEADGFLITGSRYTAFDNDPWILSLVNFTNSIIRTTAKPVVGVCFGHQIIGRALGAKVGANPGGWEITVEKIDLNEQGQKLLGVDSLHLHQMHRDAVLEIPQGLANLGTSPVCAVQVLYKPGRVFSFQGHPEFSSFITSELLAARHKSKIFDDQMFEGAMKRVDNPHSGAFISGKIWEFFLEGQSLQSRTPSATKTVVAERAKL